MPWIRQSVGKLQRTKWSRLVLRMRWWRSQVWVLRNPRPPLSLRWLATQRRGTRTCAWIWKVQSMQGWVTKYKIDKMTNVLEGIWICVRLPIVKQIIFETKADVLIISKEWFADILMSPATTVRWSGGWGAESGHVELGSSETTQSLSQWGHFPETVESTSAGSY